MFGTEPRSLDYQRGEADLARKQKVVSQTGRDTKAGFVRAEIEAPNTPDYVLDYTASGALWLRNPSQVT